MLVKYLDSKDKEKLFQVSNQWELFTYKGKRIGIALNFSSATEETRMH